MSALAHDTALEAMLGPALAMRMQEVFGPRPVVPMQDTAASRGPWCSEDVIARNDPDACAWASAWSVADPASQGGHVSLTISTRAGSEDLELTPRDARRLALHLIEAAQRAEGT